MTILKLNKMDEQYSEFVQYEKLEEIRRTEQYEEYCDERWADLYMMPFSLNEQRIIYSLERSLSTLPY